MKAICRPYTELGKRFIQTCGLQNRHGTFLFFSRFPIFSSFLSIVQIWVKILLGGWPGDDLEMPARQLGGGVVRLLCFKSTCVFRDFTVDGRNAEHSMTMFTYYRLFHRTTTPPIFLI